MSQESTSKKNERNMSAENFDRNIHSIIIIIIMIADIQEQTQCSLNYGQSNTGNAYNEIFNHK